MPFCDWTEAGIEIIGVCGLDGKYNQCYAREQQQQTSNQTVYDVPSRMFPRGKAGVLVLSYRDIHRCRFFPILPGTRRILVRFKGVTVGRLARRVLAERRLDRRVFLGQPPTVEVYRIPVRTGIGVAGWRIRAENRGSQVE